MLIGKENMDQLTDCLVTGKDANTSVLAEVLKSSAIAKHLFGSMGLRMHYALYLTEINQQLQNLEHLNFDRSESNTFTELMRKEAQKVCPSVFKDYQKNKSTISMLGSNVSPTLTCADDEHVFRLAAKIKTVAVNVGDLAMLPWEEACLVKGEIPGVSQTIHIPADVLATAHNGRDGIMDLFPQRLARLSEYTKTFANHMNDLKFLDRTCLLEFEFLVKVAPTAIRNVVHQKVLDAFPTDDAIVESKVAPTKLFKQVMGRSTACTTHESLK